MLSKKAINIVVIILTTSISFSQVVFADDLSDLYEIKKDDTKTLEKYKKTAIKNTNKDNEQVQKVNPVIAEKKDSLAEEVTKETLKKEVKKENKTEDNKAKKQEDKAKEFEDTETRVKNIYPWLPSMNNLFKGQVIQKNQDIKPFGYEIFNQDSSVFSPNESAVVSDSYIIGYGDSLQVTLWGAVSTTLDLTVNKDGKITLPEVGTFVVSGKTLGALKEQIKQKMNEVFNNISADVSVSKLRTFKVYVMGEAKRPGAYEINSTTTLFNVLFMAGGPSAIGSLRNIEVIRGNKLIKRVDLYDFIMKGNKSADIKLENNDTINFSIKGSTVSVQGLVNRPAIYEIKNEKTLNDIINVAGGTVAASYLKNIQIKRFEDNKEQVLINLDLTDKAKVKKFLLKDQDSINIFAVLPIDKKTIYLSGHVYRPGAYEYKDKMKISDVLKSYNEILPEPYTQYAQVVRLQQPDLKPLTIMFNLDDVIKGNKDFSLQPFDTIMVYSRWELTRVPEAEVIGEIFKAGKYSIVKGMRVIDLISLAGGVTKDTYLDRVEIIRRDDIYNNKKTISINLKDIFNGNTKDNIEIKDEDVIIFHSNRDINQDKFVYIEGEVTKGGKYPLGKGMRVKDLINLSGNLTKAAFIDSAEIVRYYLDGKDVKFKTLNINIELALKDDPKNNVLLEDMDRVSIKQIPKWKEIGSSITISGQVKYPGIYTIYPGEKLYDVIERAGGYLDDAYLKGAVFYRESVKALQMEKINKMISDLEQSIYLDGVNQASETNKEIKAEKILAQEQKQQYREKLLDKLKQAKVSGRLVIELDELSKFKNSYSNISLNAGDVLNIPKKVDFISVQGEVYNQTAILYKSGKTLSYYLNSAGGVTSDGDESRIHIVKTDGKVISGQGKWFYNIKDEILEPGDSILVPQQFEKSDVFEIVKSSVDIAYKTAVSAGIILNIINSSSSNKTN
ncbi:MAG: SLBB domain-containing protein [Candidatus Sericytochromatia bacterium]